MYLIINYEFLCSLVLIRVSNIACIFNFLLSLLKITKNPKMFLFLFLPKHNSKPKF